MASTDSISQETERLRFTPGVEVGALAYERQGSLVLPGYTWSHYLSLDELFQDSGVRVRFLDGYLEIMAPISHEHEERKSHLGRLLETWCVEKDIELFGCGSATLKREGEAGGKPDESYWIGEKKDRPDLAIEVALTSGGLSKRAFYAKWQVPELWIWRNGELEVFVLDSESREYLAQDSSKVLPGLDLELLVACSNEPSITKAVRMFREKMA